MSLRKTGPGSVSLLICLVLVFGLLLVPSKAFAATTDFTAAYAGWNASTGGCDSTYSIVGKEPADSGRHPLFIYVVGTFGDYKGIEPTKNITEMANRGFVAASVDYTTYSGFDTAALDGKANCIYKGGNKRSAVAQLCARARADCSKGIVTAGVSQGSFLAVRANNYESRIRAVYGLGFNDRVTSSSYFDLTTPGNRRLPADRIRIVNGGSAAPTYSRTSLRRQLNTLTGLNCDATTATSCFHENGGGWYLVQDSEVQDGVADHCYQHGAGGCSNTPAFDPGWLPPASSTWSLSTNLDWLTQFTTP